MGWQITFLKHIECCTTHEEDDQLFFFSCEPRLPSQIYRQMNKINGTSCSQATSFKLGEYNLRRSILTLRFIQQLC